MGNCINYVNFQNIDSTELFHILFLINMGKKYHFHYLYGENMMNSVKKAALNMAYLPFNYL